MPTIAPVQGGDMCPSVMHPVEHLTMSAYSVESTEQRVPCQQQAGPSLARIIGLTQAVVPRALQPTLVSCQWPGTRNRRTPGTTHVAKHYCQ